MSSPKIFISYSKDGKDYGEYVYENYRDKGYNVFFSDTNIFPGDNYERKIFENISACDYFILIGTWGALTSTYVEKELSEAIRLGKHIISCIDRTLSKSEIEESAVGKSLVDNNIDFDKFESGSNIIRIFDRELKQHQSVTKSPTPVTENTPVRKYMRSNRFIERLERDSLTGRYYPIKQVSARYTSQKSEKSPTEIWNEVISKNDFSLPDYKNAVSKDNGLGATLNYIAGINVHDTNGEWHEALVTYNSRLSANRTDPQLLINKGWVLRKLGRHSEAMQCFEDAKATGKEVLGFLPDGRPVYVGRVRDASTSQKP